jgi:hypothetical protein
MCSEPYLLHSCLRSLPMMDDELLRNRLRRLGEVGIEPGVAAAHRRRMATARRRRLPSSALAVALSVVGSVTAVGVSLAIDLPSVLPTDRPPPTAPDPATTHRDAVIPNSAEDPSGERALPGLPPFAGDQPTYGQTPVAATGEIASPSNGRRATAGRPDDRPADPPDNPPAGPPPDKPADPPAGPPPDKPADPPDNTPAGPPPGAPGGRSRTTAGNEGGG